jgi:hypothetical protein
MSWDGEDPSFQIKCFRPDSKLFPQEKRGKAMGMGIRGTFSVRANAGTGVFEVYAAVGTLLSEGKASEKRNPDTA